MQRRTSQAAAAVLRAELEVGLPAHVCELMWRCTCCSMLAERPQLVLGQEVLEIGAGTGLCGIVAAKLGASKVPTYLTPLLAAGYQDSCSMLWLFGKTQAPHPGCC